MDALRWAPADLGRWEVGPNDIEDLPPAAAGPSADPRQTRLPRGGGALRAPGLWCSPLQRPSLEPGAGSPDSQPPCLAPPSCHWTAAAIQPFSAPVSRAASPAPSVALICRPSVLRRVPRQHTHLAHFTPSRAQISEGGNSLSYCRVQGPVPYSLSLPPPAPATVLTFPNVTLPHR